MIPINDSLHRVQDRLSLGSGVSVVGFSQGTMTGENLFVGGCFMALSVGTVAPDFTVKDTQGNTVKLADYAKVVMYFYPKDDTPGCTKEACSFRDNYAQYTSQGITVFGVSMDDEASHQAFTSKFSLPFPLLADTDGAIATAYGVAGERNGFKYAQRVTFVIEAGTIVQVYETVNTETHATDILAAI